jgi:agmatine deiminase
MVSNPADDGFYLPAEWTRHARSWIGWPNDVEDRELAADIVRRITKYEPVTVLAPRGESRNVEALCGRNVRIESLPCEAMFLRDFGPTFLIDGKGGEAAVDWRFNNWGGRFEIDRGNAELSHHLLSTTEVRRFRSALTLEGTSFCTDGEGSLIALTSATLDERRNPNLDKLQAYDLLCRWLGVSRVIWIETEQPADRDTSDIRRLCAFAGPGHVLVGQLPDGPNAALLDAVSQRLREARSATGAPSAVTRVPAIELGRHLASYTSFYVLNTAVLLPQYGCQQTDSAARDVITRCFPGRAIELVPCGTLIKRGSSLSRILQYQPARLLDRSKATLLPKSSWQRPVPDYVGLLETYIARVENEE